MLTADVTVGDEWRREAATPPTQRSEITTTADQRKLFNMRTTEIETNLNLFNL